MTERVADADVELAVPYVVPADSQSLFGLVTVDPESIQVPKEGSPGFNAPNSLYMIYMCFDGRGKFIVSHLAERDFGDTVADAEGRLLIAARAGVHDEGVNFENIVWKRPYYIAFVIDNEGWRFHWGEDGDKDPIRFQRYKTGSTAIYETDNYTFFDAGRNNDLGRGDAFRFINYYRRADGLGFPSAQTKVKYSFKILLETPFADPTDSNTHIVLIIDPDGQNQGPRT